MECYMKKKCPKQITMDLVIGKNKLISDTEYQEIMSRLKQNVKLLKKLLNQKPCLSQQKLHVIANQDTLSIETQEKFLKSEQTDLPKVFLDKLFKSYQSKNDGLKNKLEEVNTERDSYNIYLGVAQSEDENPLKDQCVRIITNEINCCNIAEKHILIDQLFFKLVEKYYYSRQ